MRTTFKKNNGKGVELENSPQQILLMEEIAADNVMVNSTSSDIENDSDRTMHSKASTKCGGSSDSESPDEYASRRRGKRSPDHTFINGLIAERATTIIVSKEQRLMFDNQRNIISQKIHANRELSKEEINLLILLELIFQ